MTTDPEAADAGVHTPYYYNGCLVNWYKPEHSIGLHSDDEKVIDQNFPIQSLSWGGPRRFLVRPKKSTTNFVNKVTEIILNNGDWLIMGGLCQKEFKHEIPRLRKCDGIGNKRISWTIRKMIHQPYKPSSSSGSSSSSKRRKLN